MKSPKYKTLPAKSKFQLTKTLVELSETQHTLCV